MEIWTLQHGIQTCQQGMSPDHVLSDKMIEECNKMAPMYRPRTSAEPGSDIVPGGLIEVTSAMSREVDSLQRLTSHIPDFVLATHKYSPISSLPHLSLFDSASDLNPALSLFETEKCGSLVRAGLPSENDRQGLLVEMNLPPLDEFESAAKKACIALNPAASRAASVKYVHNGLDNDSQFSDDNFSLSAPQVDPRSHGEIAVSEKTSPVDIALEMERVATAADAERVSEKLFQELIGMNNEDALKFVWDVNSSFNHIPLERQRQGESMNEQLSSALIASRLYLEAGEWKNPKKAAPLPPTYELR